MTRFESPNTTSFSSGDEPMAAPRVSELSREDINRYVARGRALRSAYFAEYGQRLARSWASVFRRPGRLVPHAGR
jgi:hypothetical protein